MCSPHPASKTLGFRSVPILNVSFHRQKYFIGEFLVFGEELRNELNTGHLAVRTDAGKTFRILERRSLINGSFHCGRGIFVGNMSTETRNPEYVRCRIAKGDLPMSPRPISPTWMHLVDPPRIADA